MFSERANAEMKSELKITMKQMPKSARETQMNDRKKKLFFFKNDRLLPWTQSRIMYAYIVQFMLLFTV